MTGERPLANRRQVMGKLKITNRGTHAQCVLTSESVEFRLAMDWYVTVLCNLPLVGDFFKWLNRWWWTS